MAPDAPDSSGPAIDAAHHLDLPAPAAPILAALFADYARVAVEGEFGGGFSGARVLKVTPYRDADTPELPTVIKVGPADLIRQEYDAYRRHIRGRLSGIPEVWGEPVYGADGSMGGLRYALVGAGLFEFVSLARYAETASPGDLAHVLESRVFVHLGTIWRQSRLVADAPLGAAYAELLVPDRSDFFAAALASRGEGAGTRAGHALDLRAPAVAPDLGRPTISPTDLALSDPDLSRAMLPNPLIALPALLSAPIPHRIATIHGDLNLENVLVDPAARTVRLIDFTHSREDHVLHDLLRLETGLVTRVLPAKLAEAGLGESAVIDLYRRLHTAADDAPPEPALRTAYIALVAIRKAAIPLLADPADWREYFVGLAAYLLGAGKYRNLDAAAKATAFWAAAAAVDLAQRRPAANVATLDRAIPVLLERNPALEVYRRGRIAEWSGPRYELDDRFVELSLLVDQGEESTGGRWQAKEKRYASLRALLAEVADPAMVILGAPGCGKSTLLRRLELECALAGMEASDAPLTFFLPLNHYKSARAGDPPPSPRAWLAAQWSARHPTLPPLGDRLAEGRMILLLDALNEIPTASAAGAREIVAAWKDFAQEIAAMAPGSRIIFSCRSLDYSTPLSTPALRVPQIRVEPLSDEQVRRFLDQYVPNHANGLWSTLSASGHLDVVRSPYFLKLLVDQVEATGDVPLGRAALFTGFVRQALTREIERDHPLFRPDTLLAERDVHRLTAARAWRTPYELPERGILVPKLGELAYRMQERSEATGEAAQVRVDFDTALELLGHDRDADIVAAGAALGVLDEDPGRDEVLYVHQLVQEYFAARELVRAAGAWTMTVDHRPYGVSICDNSAQDQAKCDADTDNGATQTKSESRSHPRRPRTMSGEQVPNVELVRAEWRAAEIRPTLREILETLSTNERLPPLPTTGWEETTLLAVAMVPDPESFVRALMDVNLALAGRCACQPDVRMRLIEPFVVELRAALMARSRDHEADLRDRIACGLVLGEIGDPRFVRHVGVHGAFLAPPMVDIPGGTYPIGSDEPIAWSVPTQSGTLTEHLPGHTVDLAPFRMGQFPVTNAEWACFMAAGGYESDRWWDTDDGRRWRRGDLANTSAMRNNRIWRQRCLQDPTIFDQAVEEGNFRSEELLEQWRRWLLLDDRAFEAELEQKWRARRQSEPQYWRDSRFNRPSQPVVGVCWFEARAYCRWLSAQMGMELRLPTEVEWEAAARGSAGRRYPWGDADDVLAANTYATRVGQTTPVGVFARGDTPEQAADLGGNVLEWTSTLWGTEDDSAFVYPYDALDGREDAGAAPECRRVLRGGSWFNLPTVACAVARSNWMNPQDRRDIAGLRVLAGAVTAWT